jgi:transcriptional regulator with XRE-family HTH domain
MSRSPSSPISHRRFYKRPPLPTDAISRAITSRLLKLHEASGLSESQAAKKACLSHNTIFKLRTHSSIPTIDTMLRLAVVYGVDPVALIKPIDAPNNSNNSGYEFEPATEDISYKDAVTPPSSLAIATVTKPDAKLTTGRQNRADTASCKNPNTT